MELVPIDPLVGTAWDDFASAHPGYSIFHSSSWARVLANTYGHKPYYLCCLRDGELAALIPLMEVRSRITGLRGVALPFSDSCPPIVLRPLDSEILLQALRDLALERGWKYFELRGWQGLLPSSARPADSFLGHMLDLSRTPECIFSRCSSSVRRAVRKAGRSGVTARITTEPEAVVAYYTLHVRSRRRHGLPPQPFSFFLRIYEEVLQPGFGFLSIANLGSETIAGVVILHGKRNALYKFGACDRRYQEFRGSNLAMWTAIQYLASNGFSRLDLGRTSLSGEGLRRFKLSWGAQEEPIQYFRFEMNSASWAQGRDGNHDRHPRIFSFLPLSLNRALGSLLYPHMD